MSTPVSDQNNQNSFWLIVFGFWLAGAWIHWIGGFYFPQPYCDEGYFFYQARSFAESNSFFAPELHSKRTLYWMPFGYPFICGLVFKWLGTDLMWMRHVSFVFISSAFFSLAFLIRSRTFPKVNAALLGMFFISNAWLFNGNVARMESIVLALFCSGLFFGDRGKWGWAWFSIFCINLFHPIGLTLGLCFALFWWLRAEKKEYISIVLVGLAFVPLWLIANWGFQFPIEVWAKDWEFQLAGRTPEGFRILIFRWSTGFIFLVIALAGYYVWKNKLNSYWPWLSLVPMLYMVRIFGQGATYGLYTSLGIFILSVLILEAAFSRIENTSAPKYMYGVVVSMMGIGLVGSNSIQMPFVSRKSFQWSDVTQHPLYFQNEELTTIRNALDSICSQRKWKTLYIYSETVGARLYHKDQKYTQIIHNFEDTVPDGVLFFSQPDDSFEADRPVFMTHFGLEKSDPIPMKLGVYTNHWRLYSNHLKQLNPNRFHALTRCEDAGVTCPQ